MKKRTLWLALAALLAFLCLPGTAGAMTIVDSGFGFYIGAGETILPDYPDLAYLIGDGLTREDFDVSYTTNVYVESKGFDADGRATVSAGTTRPSSCYFYMIYTPKVQGVGKETVFRGKMWIREPMTKISVINPEVVLATDETAVARFAQQDGTAPAFVIADYDQNIIEAELSQTTWNERYWDIAITPKAVGETDIIVEAYNGLQATIHVTVADPPSKLSFAKETFTCYLGDTVELGMDLGGGAMNADPWVSMRNAYSYITEDDYFPDDWNHFYAKAVGEYTITMTTYNGHKATVQINVYSRKNCVSLGLSCDTVNVGCNYSIYAYDEAGKKIYPKLSITKGGEIASIVDRKLVTTGEGTVVITAVNPDGTTVDLTVEVIETPTQVYLNATELTLNIGDTFDFEVSFDKGRSDYRLDCYYDDYFPAFNLFPISLQDEHLVAQAPGTARVTVYAGSLSATCYITVLDSDAVVSLVTPEEPFGVGHTFQLSVVDRTGKTYPAVFTNDEARSLAAVVTADGQLTGMYKGTSRIYATLEDGRRLRYDQDVKLVPGWMSHPDVTAHVNYTTVGLESIETDVGVIYGTEVRVSIADESIATFGGNFFEFHQPGTTVVTLTAINGGTQCSFVLEVLDADDRLYVDNTLLNLASGYYMQLPAVTDYYGNIVPVSWEMTYHVAGNGNPSSEGFILNGDVLICTWYSAMCQVTGTAESGASIRLDVHGYRLAEEIRFQKESYTVRVGERVQTEVTTVEMGYMPGPITWYVGDESIIEFDPAWSQTGRPTALGLQPGTTTLRAVLINGVYAECTITVQAERLPGDANEDGAVDIHDALLVLQRDAGWNVSLNRDNADVDGSGSVDIYDALLILRYGAGEDVDLK